jgi:hypothetical protein
MLSVHVHVRLHATCVVCVRVCVHVPCGARRVGGHWQGCQGRGIFLTRSLDMVSPTDPQVAQRYLTKPFLIDGLKVRTRLCTKSAMPTLLARHPCSALTLPFPPLSPAMRSTFFVSLCSVWSGDLPSCSLTCVCTWW